MSTCTCRLIMPLLFGLICKHGWAARKEFIFERDGGLKVPNKLKTLRNLGLRPIYVGELCRFSFEMPADGLPGFFALDGSRIVGGAVDPKYKPLIDSGCRFIKIDGNDLILADAADFGRGKGGSGRAVGSFQGDAIREIHAGFPSYNTGNKTSCKRSNAEYVGGLYTSWKW